MPHEAGPFVCGSSGVTNNQPPDRWQTTKRKKPKHHPIITPLSPTLPARQNARECLPSTSPHRRETADKGNDEKICRDCIVSPSFSTSASISFQLDSLAPARREMETKYHFLSPCLSSHSPLTGRPVAQEARARFLC
mmetsp:Transcript_2181/g.4600  ORF Transcript_2181/g.4600 Transcript_2181/m.4600 type:complete len:137 (-) Transcript_2181:1170-1580(-)